MTIIEIKREKQSNGIWGMPLNCMKISNFRLLLNEKNYILHSALLAAIDEKYNSKFEVINMYDDAFTISIDSVNNFSKKLFYITYSNFEVIDNTLYEFDNKIEHTRFLRKYKLKYLKI